MVAPRCGDEFHRGMPNYRRVWTPGGTFFFTATMLERRHTTLVDHVDALRARSVTRAARPFDVIAIVVLPGHLHCVWRLPGGDDDNAMRWRHIKSLFSRLIPAGERISQRRRLKGERGINVAIGNT